MTLIQSEWITQLDKYHNHQIKIDPSVDTYQVFLWENKKFILKSVCNTVLLIHSVWSAYCVIDYYIIVFYVTRPIKNLKKKMKIGQTIWKFIWADFLDLRLEKTLI